MAETPNPAAGDRGAWGKDRAGLQIDPLLTSTAKAEQEFRDGGRLLGFIQETGAGYVARLYTGRPLGVFRIAATARRAICEECGFVWLKSDKERQRRRTLLRRHWRQPA